jgi:capsular exopolysaccharide synthesis family protein
MKYPYSSYNTPLPGYGTSMVDRINLYLHFRRYFKILAERWLLVVICTIIGLGLGVWQAWSKPDIFQSRSVLAVPPKVKMSSSPGLQIDEDGRLAETQIAIMKGAAVISRVMQRLQESGGSTNRVVRPDYDAVPARGGLYIMTTRGTNFDHCQKFAAAWAQEFIDYKKQVLVNLKSSTEANLSREVLQTERDLENARDELDQFKRKYNIADFKDAGARSRERLERAKSEYLNLQGDRKLYEAATAEEVAAGSIDPKRPSPSRSRNERTADEADEEGYINSASYPVLKLEFRKLESIYEEKKATLQTNHPYMRDLARNLAFKQQDIDEALRMADDSRKVRIKYLRSREDAYPKLIAALEEEVFEKNSQENEYDRLLKKELLIKEQLDGQMRSLAAANRMAVEDEQFTIMESGGGDPVPVAPSRITMVMSGVGVGFLVGVGLLLLLHKLDDRLDNPERIEEALEEPILGQLPEVDKKHYKEGYLLLNRMKSHTMFAESLRGIRSALLLSPEGTSKRLLAVTSAVPGDGKTTFTANFAITLANAGHKTLLIDADLRRGNVHGYFEQPLENGLAEVLEKTKTLAEVTRETPIKNLSLIVAGARPGNPSELLIGAATKELIMDLRRQYDYVVFDCPPLTAIDDTFSIAAYLDGLFFVVRAGKTSMRFAKMGVNTIKQRGAPIIGLVVNGVPIDNPYYYYTTYYYASYYHRPLTPDEGAYGATGPAATPPTGPTLPPSSTDGPSDPPKG